MTEASTASVRTRVSLRTLSLPWVRQALQCHKAEALWLKTRPNFKTRFRVLCPCPSFLLLR